ncbi:ArsR/SmtB family transcription factor [Winogradskya humida]|uniref:ArsR family transcriptional regulator n=1 Tax=Winogradskya humida TaxID=113566 RepID=A0ABQ3ZVK0_9ACTN|nr:winged helix-turn-helix domain-containing protein [Actinoplanes humidus]GIE22641.1 ArsR family transcriptional regulator [Actinoplanes humidus]
MLIQVSPADLAGCRYAISPLFEVEGALFLLAGRTEAGVLTSWVRRMRPQLAQLRREVPAIGALTSLFRRDDNADFLHPAPVSSRREIGEDLAVVRATPLERARAELELNLRGHRTPPEYARHILAADDVVDRLADALQAAWTTLIEPEWPRFRAVLERDIVQRAGRIAAYGWAEGLAGLHPRVTWSAESTIAIEHRDKGTYALTGNGLLLVPSVFANLAISTDPSRPVTIAYRARGIADPPGAGADLAPLIGAKRAAILRTLPATTSQLTVHLDMSLAGVSEHLKVLERAGLITRTRTGRSVLYTTTPKGDALLS